MTLFRVAASGGLALLTAATARAQGLPQSAGQQFQLNECLLPPIQGATDLIPCTIEFNSLGEIRFVLKNRGTAGVNTPAVGGGVGGRSARTGDPTTRIKMDLYLDDRLIQSVYQSTLAGAESKEFITKIPSNFPTPGCGETRQLRVVIDPGNQFSEASEANNALARAADRPCPDMEVGSIRANYNDLKTEYVAEITLHNRGNAKARFRYLALTSNSSAFGPLPAADFDVLMEIEAGQSRTFRIGNTFSYGKMYVRVFLDRFNEVAELNESNNFKEKTLPD